MIEALLTQSHALEDGLSIMQDRCAASAGVPLAETENILPTSLFSTVEARQDMLITAFVGVKEWYDSFVRAGAVARNVAEQLQAAIKAGPLHRGQESPCPSDAILSLVMLECFLENLQAGQIQWLPCSGTRVRRLRARGDSQPRQRTPNPF